MLKDQLKLDPRVVEELNRVIFDSSNPLVNEVLRVVEKYGTPEEINAKAREARKLPNLMERLRKMDSPYVKDLEWLTTERDKGAFISISEYRRSIIGDKANSMYFEDAKAVTLEISALQFFPWLITEAKQAIDKKEIMPGRYIRVRNMREQVADQGDILAVAAAMQIVGASYVESLDTRGTDGSNVHLGGAGTILGYLGGIGQPNTHPLMWADEYLHYYTQYGINEVLNINQGTILLGYMLYQLGIDIRFKISVFVGSDNPFAVLSTLMMARFLAREDGSTPLIGFNLSNSVDKYTLELSSQIRHQLGLEGKVRIEHHITEPWKNIVCQPYNRRNELLEVASTVPNISAKHEGGEPDLEATRERPSDIADYFRSKEEILASGEMSALEQNYLDKHESVNRTAKALTEKGLAFLAARNLHRR